jgi:hypothetical protein
MSRGRRLTAEQCLALLQQLDENSSNDGSDNESNLENSEENEIIEEQGSNSTDEADTDDPDTSISTRAPRDVTNLRAADGTEWKILNQDSTTPGRFAAQNVMKEKAGPTPYANRNIGENEASSWRLLFSESMLTHIQKCTSGEANRQLKTDSWSISKEEIDAFIALVYARGAMCSSSLDVNDLWSKEWGPPIFAATMSRDRFKEILRFLRFDQKSTRSARLINDKFALASEIWSPFVQNSQLCFAAGANITIDEQLLPCKARCKFIQYMANKPDKFGLKFWLAADLETKYFLNGFMYMGKDEERDRTLQLGEYVVLKLMNPFLSKGRNVTTDNFFTSQRLADSLSAKGTSIVGTVRPNRRELPPICKDTTQERFSSKVLVNGQKTLTVYKCKPKKNVCILSTLHRQVEINNSPKKVPETVEYYNSTKCGVDVLDQMSRKYTTRSASRRWPVYIFYNVLDMAAINAWILFRSCNSSNISRRCYILNLVNELRSSYCATKKLPAVLPCRGEVKTNKRRQCSYCRNKTQDLCSSCEKPTCGTCQERCVKSVHCKKCVDETEAML